VFRRALVILLPGPAAPPPIGAMWAREIATTMASAWRGWSAARITANSSTPEHGLRLTAVSSLQETRLTILAEMMMTKPKLNADSVFSITNKTYPSFALIFLQVFL